MNIGVHARRHGTTALLGLAIAGFGTATALAGSAPLPPTALPVPPALSATPTAVAKLKPAKAELPAKLIRIRRQAQAVPFFAFPPRI